MTTYKAHNPASARIEHVRSCQKYASGFSAHVPFWAVVEVESDDHSSTFCSDNLLFRSYQGFATDSADRAEWEN